MFKNRHFQVKFVKDAPETNEGTTEPTVTAEDIERISRETIKRIAIATVATIAVSVVLNTLGQIAINALDTDKEEED